MKQINENELYLSYGDHFKRMLNELPSKQIDMTIIKKYHMKPWMPEDMNASILDIGCGYGTQLYILSKLGYKKLYGIEIVKESCSIAEKEVGRFANIEQSNAFAYLPNSISKFDIIILNDVLEHIPREKVVELLTLANKALKVKGTIVIRVPNMSSLLGAYSMHLDFTHVNGFTEYSLMQVLDLGGFHEHNIIRNEYKLNILNWRPWKSFKGLGLKSLLKYKLNEYLHRAIYSLRQQRPVPSVYDFNIEIYSKKI